MVKAKAKIENRTLKAKVKYPLAGRAELELGPASTLKAIIKVPFLFKAKLLGLFKLKEEKKK